MNTTNNYGLKKPEPTDFYNVADQNANMDAIDTALKEQADAIDAVQSGVEANASAIRNVEASVLSPMDIADMIDSRPVTNAVYAESAGSAVTATTATSANTANALSGQIATTHELNQLSGISGNVQAQINGKQANLGYAPVQQGGGNGQLSNKVFIGWSGSRVKVQIDQSDMGNVVFDNHLAPYRTIASGSVVAIQAAAPADGSVLWAW